MRYFKSIACVFFISFYLGMFIGCSTFDRHQKNSEGYYERHFHSCGPIALEKAINAYYANQEIVFAKNPAPRKEISKFIQNNARPLVELLSYFNKDAVEITWPCDIERVIKKYGYRIISIKDFNKLNLKEDVAIVLVNTNLNNYHWLCFPIDKNIKSFFGPKTKISKIYLLKKK